MSLSEHLDEDDNKEGKGIFRRTFNPYVGEKKVSLEIRNPSPDKSFIILYSTEFLKKLRHHGVFCTLISWSSSCFEFQFKDF